MGECLTAMAAKAARRWMRRQAPFPHVVVANVFSDEVHREMEVHFREILGRGFGGPAERDRFGRNIPGYDVCSYLLPPGFSGPLGVFLTREWHDMLAGVLGIEATDDVTASLHHHPVGSGSGSPHNDLNPGWFVGEATPETVNVLDANLVNYYNGRTTQPGLNARETVRAGVVIYYLANEPWAQGDGGETALYRTGSARVDNWASAVPPVNNSLVAFECTPYSFHSFLRNTRHPRNSVIMWAHRPKEEVVRRWGARTIVSWSKH